jgi:hypothetical protein
LEKRAGRGLARSRNEVSHDRPARIYAVARTIDGAWFNVTVLNQRSRHEVGLDFIFAKVRFAAEADGFLCLGANISCSLFLESAIVDECHGVANIEISQSCSYKKD